MHKKKRNKWLLAIFVVVVLVTSLIGCNLLQKDPTGSLRIHLSDEISTRTLIPILDMTPASYLISGEGPNEADSFIITENNVNSAEKAHLAVGDWLVKVIAMNAEGVAIGEGSGMVTIEANIENEIDIAVIPYSGYGTLALEISYNAAEFEDPRISSILLPVSGQEYNLSINIDAVNGLADVRSDDIATGYYTLLVQIFEGDESNPKYGKMEVVRIVSGETTEGVFDFGETTHTHGNITVKISSYLADPLEIVISGQIEKTVSEVLELQAYAANYNENISFIWYVNGDSRSSGDRFSLDDSWDIGTYQVDVAGFTADGTRAGSTGAAVQITEKVEVSVTGVTISEIEQELTIDETIQLTAILTPEEATNRNLSWVSENDTIANVSENGLVTGISPGNTVITVRTEDGCFTDSVNIMVAYELGNIGPAGGYIFYDDTIGFDLNEDGRISVTEKDLLDGNNDGIYQGERYLEAAPYGWFDTDFDGEYGEDNDPSFFEWGVFGSYGGVISDNSGIGYGRDNTDAIVSFHENLGVLYPDIGSYEYNAKKYNSLNDGTLAAKACQEADINGYHDWFLPSRFELIALYENLHKTGIGGLQNSYYWSSTDSLLNSAYIVWMSSGNSYKEEKFLAYSVRAIRSF